MFLRTERDGLIAVSQTKHIAEAHTKHGFEVRATLADGRERLLAAETLEDVLLEIAPVVPAQEGHFVAIASDATSDHDEAVRVGLNLHEVVAFKIADGRACPIIPGIDLREYEYVLHVSPRGTLTDISEQRVFSGFYAWLDAVACDLSARNGKPLNVPVRKLAA